MPRIYAPAAPPIADAVFVTANSDPLVDVTLVAAAMAFVAGYTP